MYAFASGGRACSLLPGRAPRYRKKVSSVDLPPPSRTERGGHLLRANAALADEAAWLGHLNRYLATFGLAPLELNPGPGSRLLRVGAVTPRRIETGPRVSVLMPAWNAAETLEWAAGSVLQQSWRPLELLIIDDASTDATGGIAAELARRDRRVRVLRLPKNAGPFVAKNVAARAASGDFITGLDADEWAHPERLERLMALLLADGRLRGTRDGMLRVRRDGRIAQFGQREAGDDAKILRPCFSGACFERRFFLQELGGFDTVRFAADGELIERAQRLLGAGFDEQRMPGALSMDGPETLSRHPEHGISRRTGLSPVRQQYRENYLAWHAGLGPGEGALPFPHEPRRFEAPEPMRVASEALEAAKRVLV